MDAGRPVVDPALGLRTQWWLRRLIARKIWPANKLLIERVMPVQLAVCVLCALVSGLALGWLLGVVVSACATFAVRREIRFAGLRRHRSSYVERADLDDASSRELWSAQCAIGIVLSAEVYRTGQLDSPVRAVDLRQHEWEIASRLWDITRLRVEYLTNVADGIPGPHTAAVLEAHGHAITFAQAATTHRIEELQRFASEVRASDLALLDLRKAERLALGNDRYLDLVAHSAADEYAIAEFGRLTDDAARAREAYQAALDRATQAAGPLALVLSVPPAATSVC